MMYTFHLDYPGHAMSDGLARISVNIISYIRVLE